MKVYSCSGFAFDDAGSEGIVYFRTKAEALSAAREATAASDKDTEGSEAKVYVDTIGQIHSGLVIALLNRAGWSTSSDLVATVRNGRVIAERSE